jgi:hypothetical protein
MHHVVHVSSLKVTNTLLVPALLLLHLHLLLRLVHTNMCLLPIPALFRRRRRLPLCCPVQL